MRLLGVMILLVGCDAGMAVGPDTPTKPVDGPQGDLGMFVRWNADPSLPGSLTEKITVSDVTFQIDHFQILADAGSITRSKYVLAWDREGSPQQDMFPEAPPGVYSKITLAMMGGGFGENSFRIRGTWRDNGPPKLFEIHDRSQLSISFDCDQTLSAASSATIDIKVDLEAAIEGINFKNLDSEDGVLELHDGPELMAFRGRLQRSFALDR